MAIIKKVGAPTRLTEGSVGDTYIDLKTKKAYICVAAYKASTGSVDYTWHENEDGVVGEVDNSPGETPVVAPVQEEPTEEPDGSPEIDEEPEVKENAKKPKRNYNKQYKKH